MLNKIIVMIQLTNAIKQNKTNLHFVSHWCRRLFGTGDASSSSSSDPGSLSQCKEWFKAYIFQLPSPVGRIQGDSTPLLYSVDVLLLLTLVTESPGRISRTLSVS